MNRSRTSPKRVLAIHPKPRGFGFAVLESPKTLVDWGVKATRRQKEATTLAKVTELIRLYQPQTLLLEDGSSNSRRCRRIKHLLDRLRALAIKTGIKPCGLSASSIKKLFLSFGARTKYEIARVIAQQMPELASRLPRRRKIYESEDYWMASFDAVALALTYFYTRPAQSRKTPAP